jgi:hypothetical protein
MKKPARIDYSFLSQECQYSVQNIYKYVLKDRKTGRFIFSHDAVFHSLQSPTLGYCGNFLTNEHIKDLFGNPTYEDKEGLYYRLTDKKDKNGKYNYLLVVIGKNKLVQLFNFQCYRDTK